jgi:hypothetical protein
MGGLLTLSVGGGCGSEGGGVDPNFCFWPFNAGRDCDANEVTCSLLLELPKGATCGGLSLALNIIVFGADFADVGCREIGCELPGFSELLLCPIDFKGLSKSAGIKSSS